MENKVIIFESKNIRRELHNGEWYFSVIDIIEILTESAEPRKYWNTLKSREPQLSSVCGQLKMTAQDGRKRLTDCANTEGVFRIVMSVPSPKAEPLKLWLAEQGKRTIDETENPELGFERLTELYKAKGYSDEWIDRRLKGISVRKELTDEWKKRDVKEGHEYSILTAIVAKGTFGLSPSEHAQYKGLAKENLRDHMTPMELILTALGEEVTRTMAVKNDAQGFNENVEAAAKGGEAGGKARRNVEEITGEKVVSPTNYLKQIEDNTKELPPNDKK
jgi:DNA-damage-inducible protein D